MFSSMTMEVLLALAITYTGLSIVSSLIAEWIAKHRDRRAGLLKEHVSILLNDSEQRCVNLQQVFYSHPSIAKLTSGNKLPSYISSKMFSLTILDLFVVMEPPANDTAGTTTIRTHANDASQTPVPDSTQRLLRTVLFGTSGSIGHAQDRLEKSFDEWMLRVEGIYKRELKRYILVIAFLLVSLLNIDTLNIARVVLAQPAIQSALQEVGKNAPSDKADVSVQSVFLWNSLHIVPLPLGWWQEVRSELPGISPTLRVLKKIAGLYLSVMAVAFGTPFWFDVINKIVNIRQVGQKPPSTAQR